MEDLPYMTWDRRTSIEFDEARSIVSSSLLSFWKCEVGKCHFFALMWLAINTLQALLCFYFAPILLAVIFSIYTKAHSLHVFDTILDWCNIQWISKHLTCRKSNAFTHLSLEFWDRNIQYWVWLTWTAISNKSRSELGNAGWTK